MVDLGAISRLLIETAVCDSYCVHGKLALEHTLVYMSNSVPWACASNISVKGFQVLSSQNFFLFFQNHCNFCALWSRNLIQCLVVFCFRTALLDQLLQMLKGIERNVWCGWVLWFIPHLGAPGDRILAGVCEISKTILGHLKDLEVHRSPVCLSLTFLYLHIINFVTTTHKSYRGPSVYKKLE